MIREMRDEDWGTVAEIYKQGLEEGTSTFNTECPSFAEWNEGHLSNCRFVCEEEGKVLCWIALSPTSSRCAYKGCVEMSVYVDRNYRGHRIGTALVNTIIKEAEKDGYWSIYSAIFSINKASIALHKKCGFREIGYRERIAKDRFGKWQNTTLMEYRAS